MFNADIDSLYMDKLTVQAIRARYTSVDNLHELRYIAAYNGSVNGILYKSVSRVDGDSLRIMGSAAILCSFFATPPLGTS